MEGDGTDHYAFRVRQPKKQPKARKGPEMVYDLFSDLVVA